jgi:hypothetical protein
LLSALTFLPPASAPELRMTVLGDSIREVGFGESGEYRIGVSNIGDETTRLIQLKLTGIPEHWNAELSHEFISIPAKSTKTIRLTVTAPTMEAAAEAERTGGLMNVASVDVRGGNVTVGTVTVLKGTLELQREGDVEIIGEDDGPYTVEAGDVLTARGFAMVVVDTASMFSSPGENYGKIYIGLHDATVGFWVSGGTGFMWILDGQVVVLGTDPEDTRSGDFGPPDGTDELQELADSGPIAGTRGENDGWTLHIGRNLALDTSLLGLVYNAALSFGPEPGKALFYMNVDVDGTTETSVFDGTLWVKNIVDQQEVGSLESSAGVPGSPLPRPWAALATIIDIESGTDSEEIVEFNGMNVFDIEDAHILIDANNRDIYIIPGFTRDSANISVSYEGKAPGQHHANYTFIEDFHSYSFAVDSYTSSSSFDTVNLTRDTMEFDSGGEDKNYTVAIFYKDSGGRKSAFRIHDIITTDGYQRVDVVDWVNLTRTLGAVTFTQDDDKIPNRTVAVENGEDGESLLQKLTTDLDERDRTLVYFLTVLTLLCLGMTFILFGKVRRLEKPDHVWIPQEEYDELIVDREQLSSMESRIREAEEKEKDFARKRQYIDEQRLELEEKQAVFDKNMIDEHKKEARMKRLMDDIEKDRLEARSIREELYKKRTEYYEALKKIEEYETRMADLEDDERAMRNNIKLLNREKRKLTLLQDSFERKKEQQMEVYRQADADIEAAVQFLDTQRAEIDKMAKAVGAPQPAEEGAGEDAGEGEEDEWVDEGEEEDEEEDEEEEDEEEEDEEEEGEEESAEEKE